MVPVQLAASEGAVGECEEEELGFNEEGCHEDHGIRHWAIALIMEIADVQSCLRHERVDEGCRQG